MAPAHASLTIKDVDRGWARLLRELRSLQGGAYVKVGAIGEVKDLHEGDTISVVALMVIHEFGAPEAGVPERSFLRATCDKMGPTEWNLLREKLVGLIYDGKMDVEQALGVLGAKASSDVKAFITEGDEVPPPAAPATFLRKLNKGAKGFNLTGAAPRNLVDSGRMVGSITWQVIVSGSAASDGAKEG